MYNTKTYTEKPLTPPMIECLFECHERELMNLFPCEAVEKGAKGLLDRGFVRADFIKNCHGKRFMCVHLTLKGRRYLENNL